MDASVDLRMTIVEEEWVLSVVLDLALALRLSADVIVVAGLENIIILLLIVWDVPSLRSLDELESSLKKTFSVGVCQHFWMIIIN